VTVVVTVVVEVVELIEVVAKAVAITVLVAVLVEGGWTVVVRLVTPTQEHAEEYRLKLFAQPDLAYEGIEVQAEVDARLTRVLK